MQQIDVQVLTAFTDGDAGGNPAGVVLNADHLTTAQKQEIASRVALSETAFVSHSSVADIKLEFFTPVSQIAHCGHATIATFSYLSRVGKLKGAKLSKETTDGVREVLMIGSLAFMEQRAPSFKAIDQADILLSIGITPDDLLEDQQISIVDTGNAFAIIPLSNAQVLKMLSPKRDQITQLSERYGLIGYYAFSTQTSCCSRDASARMFAPRFGISEESGSGMAAGPLACYLYNRLGLRKKRLLIEQGQLMCPPSPSLLMVSLTVKQGIITKVMAGGKGIWQGSMPVNYTTEPLSI
jgi:PhzF family phenazine biosynthesis protein